MKKDYLASIALYMIFLIITIPIYSSSVMGATITQTYATGKAGIPNYRGQTDTTTINVEAQIPEDADISPTQVKVLEDPTQPFLCEAATNLTGTVKCKLDYPENTVSNTVVPYTIQIFDDNGNAITPPRQASFTVDTLPPKVDYVTYSAKPGGVVEAKFNVLDEACTAPECAFRCSGMADIKFTVAGSTVGDQASFPSDTCNQSGIINLTGMVIGGEVTTKHVCLEAIDRMGQSSSTCTDVAVDAKPPQITGIGLYDAAGNRVISSNGNPIGNLKLKINITEDSALIDPMTGAANSIHINASDLSERTDHKAAFGNMVVTCSYHVGNQYTCETPASLFLIATSQRTVSVQVSAKDDHENNVSSTQTIPITFDNIAPVASKIYSNYIDDKGAYWVTASGNSIYMDITEAGSGFLGRRAYLDFSGFGPQSIAWGGSVVLLAPYSCTPGWRCWWPNISTSKTSGTTLSLRPMTGSMDDATNALTPTTGTFKVDTLPPQIDAALLKYSNITGTGENHPAMKILSSGDALEIHMFVKDYSGIKSATANLTGIIDNGPADMAGTCTENAIIPGEPQRVYECVWETNAIRNGYIKDLSINFTFTDNTNQSTVYSWKNIEILARENATVPRWKAVVSAYSPLHGIDRLSWGLGSQRMYYQLDFSADSSVQGIVSLNFDPTKCTAGLEWVNQDAVTSRFLISMAGFTDFTTTPTSDIVTLELNPGNVPPYSIAVTNVTNVSLNNVTVNCIITMQSIVTTNVAGAQKALSLPEDINVSFFIPVYNNPLGQNIGNIKDKIKSEQKEVSEKYWKAVYWTKVILQYAREMCRFIELYISLTILWGGIHDLFSGTCSAPAGYPSCAAARAAGQSVDAFQKATNGFVGQLYFFCGLFISCRLSKNAKAAMNQQCNQKDSGWCEVKKTWAGINGWMADLVNVKLGEYETGFKSKATGVETKGISVFSVDDFDPTRSMISSVLSGCLPGLMINLDKWRQIKCQRLLCYKIDVANGRPMNQC